VPPLLLQPLVENAIRHGIAVSSAAGHITLGSRVSGQRLLIEVTDDGPGMNGQPAGKGSGTGLRNTRERLERIYGDDHRFDLSSDGTGTRIRIDIPAMSAGDVESP
jgi:LytS/YehU family sensor histidine kinase